MDCVRRSLGLFRSHQPRKPLVSDPAETLCRLAPKNGADDGFLPSSVHRSVSCRFEELVELGFVKLCHPFYVTHVARGPAGPRENRLHVLSRQPAEATIDGLALVKPLDTRLSACGVLTSLSGAGLTLRDVTFELGDQRPLTLDFLPPAFAQFLPNPLVGFDVLKRSACCSVTMTIGMHAWMAP